MKIDLHLHSRLSDGSQTPEEILQQGEQAGIRILAITDHEILMSSQAFATLQASYRVRLIPGVEVSCYAPRARSAVHLLAYLPQPGRAPICKPSSMPVWNVGGSWESVKKTSSPSSIFSPPTVAFVAVPPMTR